MNQEKDQEIVSIWNTERIIGVSMSTLLTMIVYHAVFTADSFGYCLILIMINVLMIIIAFFPVFYPPIKIEPKGIMRQIGIALLMLFVILAFLEVIIYGKTVEPFTLLFVVKISFLVFLEVSLAIYSFWLTVLERQWVLPSDSASTPDLKENLVEKSSNGAAQPVIENSAKRPYADVVQPEKTADPLDPLEPPVENYFQPEPPEDTKGDVIKETEENTEVTKVKKEEGNKEVTEEKEEVSEDKKEIVEEKKANTEETNLVIANPVEEVLDA